MKPILSVIITTRNSEPTIELCLNSITTQSFSDVEIILVDNHSTDDTIKIAEKYSNHMFQHGPERSAQRNYGAKRALGTYLLFLDSDMELSPDVLTEVLKEFEKGFIGIYIPEVVAGTSLWSRVRTFERSFYNQTSIDAVRAVTSEAFREVNGFDELLTGPEDWDFDKRIRMHGKTSIIKAPIKHHEEHTTLKSYLSKKMYYAHDFTHYKEKWGHDDPDVRNQFGFYYRFWGVYVEHGKWKRLISHPFLSILMYLVRIALGVSYLVRKNGVI